MKFLIIIISLVGASILSGCASCKSDYGWLLQQSVGKTNPEQMRMWLSGKKMQITDKSDEGVLTGDDGVGCKAVLRFENGVFSSYQLEGNKCYRPRACLVQ